jgi:5,10-methylenetetrahydrofolate reductase
LNIEWTGAMPVSAEALGPKNARELLETGADEVLMPCIGSFEDAAAKAGRVDGPVAVHLPANRVDGPEAALEVLREHGVERALVVSGNPGHGRGTRTIYELIPFLREAGIHVSVGAYPEDYFSTTSRTHRSKSASILVDKQAAGAQRILTQASFSTSNMRKWLAVVRSRGVALPIHVGVMGQVPRKTLGKILRNARAEILSHPRMTLTNKPDLDLLFRMLRSLMPDPQEFIETVAGLDQMGSEDGFHIFAYGGDATALFAATRKARSVHAEA